MRPHAVLDFICNKKTLLTTIGRNNVNVTFMLMKYNFDQIIHILKMRKNPEIMEEKEKKKEELKKEKYENEILENFENTNILFNQSQEIEYNIISEEFYSYNKILTLKSMYCPKINVPPTSFNYIIEEYETKHGKSMKMKYTDFIMLKNLFNQQLKVPKRNIIYENDSKSLKKVKKRKTKRSNIISRIDYLKSSWEVNLKDITSKKKYKRTRKKEERKKQWEIKKKQEKLYTNGENILKDIMININEFPSCTAQKKIKNFS
jgi:hypothetical protein